MTGNEKVEFLSTCGFYLGSQLSSPLGFALDQQTDRKNYKQFMFTKSPKAGNI